MSPDEYAQYVERLGDEHAERLVRSLQSLEDRIANFANNAPTKDGQLFDLEWAVSARATIQQELNTLLVDAQLIMDEYQEVSTQLGLMLGNQFANLPNEVVNQLQSLSFQGFEEIVSTYGQTISDELYQYTLVGRTPDEMTQKLRGTINGVYQNADKDEIDRLVEIANTGSDVAKADAIKKLHTIYGSDKLGNNLRRYASTYMRDSIQQFSAQATIATANDAGVDEFEYYGNTINDTRDHCRKHVGKTYTREEIYDLWDADWKGKQSGDPFIVRGGYNCRHHWLPIIN